MEMLLLQRVHLKLVVYCRNSCVLHQIFIKFEFVVQIRNQSLNIPLSQISGQSDEKGKFELTLTLTLAHCRNRTSKDVKLTGIDVMSAYFCI